MAGDPAAPPAIAEMVVSSAHEAFTEGWQLSMWAGAALAAAAVVFAALRGPTDAVGQRSDLTA